MPRRKALAKKPAPTVPIIQGSGHLRFHQKDVQDRYECYRSKTIFKPYVIDLGALEEVGIRDEVAALVEPPEWKFLLVDFREDIYADLLLEVMATLQVPTQFELNSTRCIHFSVGHTAFHSSLDDLSRIMGFDDLQGLSEQGKRDRICQPADTQAFWREMTDGKTAYRSSSSKSTSFRKEHKFLQYVLARSICGRQESSGTVSHTDLLCLYGMVKRQKVHMGFVLGQLFLKQHQLNVRAIFLGPYVTRIIRNTQTQIIHDIQEDPVGDMTVINQAILGWIFSSKQAKKRARTTEVEEEVEIEGDVGEGPDRGEGSAGSTFQQQVLSQLAAMQIQMGQIYSKVENLEAAVGRLETREESSAYQAWLRGQFPPSGGPPHDPSHEM